MSETMQGGRFASLVLHLVDVAIVRLASIAAHMEQEIRGGNPAFDQHRVEDHGAGYRCPCLRFLRSATAYATCDASAGGGLVTVREWRPVDRSGCG